MKKHLALFLQVVTVVIGIGTLAFMLLEPQLEGRNVHATFFSIYFNDPFLAFAYIASIPFFVILYETFKVLGYAGQNKIFSQPVVNALRTIRYCAVAIIGLSVVGENLIRLNNSDDRAGGVFMGLLIIAASGIIHIAATRFGNFLQKRMQQS